MMIQTLHRHDPGRPAIVECSDNRIIRYEQLVSLVEQQRQVLSPLPRPALAMLYCGNTIGSITAYLACLATGTPVCLVEPKPQVFASLAESYRPSLAILPPGMAPPDRFSESCALDRAADGDRYQVHVDPQQTPYPTALHHSLALLLTTSGSTGASKLVRLSLNNAMANARSIAAYLNLGRDERSIQSLPMHYAYGLSLINSHLVSGGTIVLTRHSCMRHEFWRDFDSSQCTSFAGVPHMYQLLRRLRINPAARSTLRTMTQAGGGMSEDLTRYYLEASRVNRKRLIVMYGQTEATARISYVPYEHLERKAGSIGTAIPGGSLSVEPLSDEPELGQLIYKGPNVMLGYADGPEDLALGDSQAGRLATGDLARIDEDGFFYLTGRLKRLAKVFGRRFHLADIERFVESAFSCRAAAAERNNRIRVIVEADHDIDLSAIRLAVAQDLDLRPHSVSVDSVGSLPMTSTGKVDYPAVALA